VGEAARVLWLKQQGISAACREGGRVVGKRGQPDYKFSFEFAEPTEPDLLEGEEWKCGKGGCTLRGGVHMDHRSLRPRPLPAAA
jgi:hypothetical protein